MATEIPKITPQTVWFYQIDRFDFAWKGPYSGQEIIDLVNNGKIKSFSRLRSPTKTNGKPKKAIEIPLVKDAIENFKNNAIKFAAEKKMAEEEAIRAEEKAIEDEKQRLLNLHPLATLANEILQSQKESSIKTASLIKQIETELVTIRIRSAWIVFWSILILISLFVSCVSIGSMEFKIIPVRQY